MADTSKLESAISAAQKTLTNIFSQTSDFEGPESLRYPDFDELIKAYSTEIDISVISNNILDISNAISSMRSTYLPIDLYKDFTGIFQENVADELSMQESYENTFMRMLGMPQSSELENGAGNIFVIQPDGKFRKGSSELVYDYILNERMKPKSKRRVNICSSMYNIFDLQGVEYIVNTSSEREESDNVDSEILALEAPTEAEFGTDEESARIKANLLTLEDDIYKFSYLLFPPVQDSRISSCLNESAKTVPKNFASRLARKTNGNTLNSSLLEAVIRIRLDRISGSTSFLNSSSSTTQDDSEDDIFEDLTIDESEVTADEFGILESLFILRLSSALSGLAKKMAGDVEQVINNIIKTGQVPVDSECETETPNGDGLSDDRITNESQTDDISKLSSNSINVNLVVENSLAALFQDNSEALDLQTKTQRNSSVYKSHVMSSLIGIVNLPKTRMQSTQDSNTEKAKKSSIEGDPQIESINKTLGTSKGIGVIDITAFSLAMFTVPESVLLGLLSESEFEKIKNGEFKALLPPETEKMATIDALNEFTLYVKSAYSIFIEEFNKQ